MTQMLRTVDNAQKLCSCISVLLKYSTSTQGQQDPAAATFLRGLLSLFQSAGGRLVPRWWRRHKPFSFLLGPSQGARPR